MIWTTYRASQVIAAESSPVQPSPVQSSPVQAEAPAATAAAALGVRPPKPSNWSTMSKNQMKMRKQHGGRPR